MSFAYAKRKHENYGVSNPCSLLGIHECKGTCSFKMKERKRRLGSDSRDMKPIRFSAFGAKFNAYIYPGPTARARFSDQSSTVLTIKRRVGNLFTAFWTSRQRNAPLDLLTNSTLKL